MQQCWSRKSCTEICSADRLLAIRDSLHVVLSSFLFCRYFLQLFGDEAATRPPREANEFIESHNRRATILTDVPQARPPAPPHYVSCGLSHSLPTRRRRYFKCRCGFTPTTSSPVKRAINHPPPSRRHLRLQDPDSRLPGGGTRPTFYGRLFKVFLHFSKRSKMFHLLATILGSQRQKRKKPKIKQGRAAPAAFPFLFLAKWISAARRRPDNPGDARRLLSSRSQRGSSFGTAARRLQRWPSF